MLGRINQYGNEGWICNILQPFLQFSWNTSAEEIIKFQAETSKLMVFWFWLDWRHDTDKKKIQAANDAALMLHSSQGETLKP